MLDSLRVDFQPLRIGQRKAEISQPNSKACVSFVISPSETLKRRRQKPNYSFFKRLLHAYFLFITLITIYKFSLDGVKLSILCCQTNKFHLINIQNIEDLFFVPYSVVG